MHVPLYVEDAFTTPEFVGWGYMYKKRECWIGIYELNPEIVGCENAFWDVLQD